MEVIRLTYKHIINAASSSDFDKSIFHLTYDEFLLKVQTYLLENPCNTFSEIKKKDGRANSLHYKISFPVNHLLTATDTMPVIKDNMGNNLRYDMAKTELVESDITDREKHEVAIIYTTPELVLRKTIGEYLLLSKKEDTNEKMESTETFMIRVQPYITITHFQYTNQ